ncbi:hypothetical protein I9W82_003573 [Candida metapsilosis]|uniref:J domain-containing protein n=1 Tax=Candida metapsilosis TaxID=273372 RepID=A0A8H7ZBK9_9ASCO|nr:hypothetical protein I9W82_003573 [Candida metapsilosis]
MVKSIRVMIETDTDLHRVLKVSKSATPLEIRNAYVKQALIYHPDNRPKKERKFVRGDFNLISTSYQILADPSLRKQYNDIMRIHKSDPSKSVRKIAGVKKLQQILKNKQKASQQTCKGKQKASQQTFKGKQKAAQQKFKDRQKASPQSVFSIADLDDKETHKRPPSVNLEQLRQQGVKRRNVLEEEFRKQASIYDIPVFETLQFNTSRVFTARLKYKSKSVSIIDESSIKGIMSVFGNVKEVELLDVYDDDDDYGHALVEFDDVDALNAAIYCDYATASHWDGTKYRALADLLVSCESEFGPYGEKWTNNAIVNSILDQHVQSLSDGVVGGF